MCPPLLTDAASAEKAPTWPEKSLRGVSPSMPVEVCVCVCVCARVLSPRVRVARPVSWRGHECHDMGAVFSLHGRRAAQYTGVGRENCKAWGGLHLRLKRKVICCGDTYLN